MLASAANALIQTFLSPSCAICGLTLDRPLRGSICRACRHGIRRLTPPLCVLCGEPLPPGLTGPWCARCDAEKPGFAMARSVGRYEGRLRDAIHAFKYRRRRALAVPLAAWLADTGRDLLERADAVVPVPIHPLRAIERGFNQADDLATSLHRPVWRVLCRVRVGPPQAGLPAHLRRSNVRRAFALGRCWGRLSPPLQTRRLRGAVVVLIDDVMTTGATLDACSRVLLDAGARRVSALTVARSVPARPARPPEPPPLSDARRR